MSMILDGDFAGHPFRGSQWVTASGESKTAVHASKKAKRAERAGDAAVQKKAHKIAHHAHMAAAEEATTEKSRKYHETMAKFHGGRAGVRMDDVTVQAMLDGIELKRGWDAATVEKFRRYSDTQLKLAMKDFIDAAELVERLGDKAKADEFRDQTAYVGVEIERRKRGGKEGDAFDPAKGPLALMDGVDAGQFKPGDVVLMKVAEGVETYPMTVNAVLDGVVECVWFRPDNGEPSRSKFDPALIRVVVRADGTPVDPAAGLRMDSVALDSAEGAYLDQDKKAIAATAKLLRYLREFIRSESTAARNPLHDGFVGKFGFTGDQVINKAQAQAMLTKLVDVAISRKGGDGGTEDLTREQRQRLLDFQHDARIISEYFDRRMHRNDRGRNQLRTPEMKTLYPEIDNPGDFDNYATRRQREHTAMDGIDQDGYVGKVYRGSELIGRVDIAGDGKAMIFVGPSGGQRVTEVVMGERTPARYSDADTGDLIGMLLENLAGEQVAQSAPIELPYKFASATQQAMRLFSVAHGGGAPKNAYKTAVRVEESLPNGTVVNWDSVADLPDTGTRLDDVAGLFGADQGGGYVVGEVKTSDGKLVATVTIRGDGAAMFEPSDAYAKSVGGIDPDDDDEGWGGWIDYDMMENMLTELHDAASDMRPPTEQEAEALAAQAERDRKAAEEQAAADAARQALADAAKAFGEGKKGFLGVVDNPGKVGASVSALMQRKPAGSFVFVVDRDWKAPDAAGKAVFGVAMWSRQKLGKSGRSIDPNGKIGNVQVTGLVDAPEQAYLAGTKALTSAGGVVLGAPKDDSPQRYNITAERISGDMKSPGGFALTINGERREFVGEEPEDLADRAAELAVDLSVPLSKALARLAVDEGWDKREATSTAQIQDPNIGREWDTPKGRRQIVGTFGDDMYEAKSMSTGGVLRIFKAKLEEQIAADQLAMTPEYAQQKAAEKAAREAQAARDAEDAAKGAALDAEIAKWTSDAGMSAMLAERARAALTKNRDADGKLATVGEIIREQVAAGAMVADVRGEDRLTSPSGSYLGEAQITKMGMDYARWLVAKSGATGGADPAPAAEPPALTGLRDIIAGKHDSTPLPELLAKIEELITALGGAEDLTGDPAQVANDAITHWVKLDEKANG